MRTLSRIDQWRSSSSLPLLALGVVLLLLTHNRFGVQFLAWFVYVPFFLYLRRTQGRVSLLVFGLVLFLSQTLVTLKIITEPIPWYFAFIYALPITLLHLPGYLAFRWFRRRSNWWLIGAGAFAVAEWLLGALTPFGTWGALAYARMDDLALLQFGALFGLSGVSLVLLIVNGALAAWIERGLTREALSALLLPVLGFVLAVYLFGWLRLTIYEGVNKETIAVATIDHDVTGFTFDAAKAAEFSRRSQEANIAWTIEAAQAGATAVGWMEGSTIVAEAEEAGWKDRLSKLAAEQGIHIAAAYVVPLSQKPLLMANKIVWVRPDGGIDHEYEKNVPVPGEPVRKGALPPRAVVAEGGRIFSAAICYDYDFPSIAHKIGRLGADIVFLPSGDWRGIDPIHSQMSAYRAIENGHAIVRPVNAGLSCIISPVGRILARRSDFDTGPGFLLSDVPAKKLFTPYTLWGEWSILLPVLVSLLAFWRGGPATEV